MRFITFIFSLFVLTTSFCYAQNKTYKLSAHVLNTYEGIPAEGVNVQLYKQDAATSQWALIDERSTDHDGRVNDFLDNDTNQEGVYKLQFFSRDYFIEKCNKTSIFPFIEVVVELGEEPHYHIPITISPLGFGTYKGR